MFIRAIIFLLCLCQSRCSVVIDYLSQKDHHLTDYCTKTPHCEEGSHIMCMYYNPKRVMGPRCSNAQNISVTPDLADKLLEVSNAIRSRIALGKETGKNGTLPRGYGIFRLSWDEELATFAQVLANQCVLTRDLCRSTKRFPDPAQATGLVRFTYPDWLTVSNKSHFTTSNLTPSKLNYAITQTMKAWYSQKNYVTTDMVLSYPPFQQNPRSQYGTLYLKLIYGPATHMGCGISAYTQFTYHDNNSPLNYNVVQIVCNYSAKPSSPLIVYTTTPPTQIGYTIKCGCPDGYDEDADCLCFESPKQPVPTPSPNFCSDDSCKQSVVLLPIFTVEDAPPHQLLPLGVGNKSLRIGPTDFYNHRRNYRITPEPQSLSEFSELLRGSDITRDTNVPQPFVQRRFENRKLTNKLHHYNKSNHPTSSHVSRKHTAKGSIFSRAEKFHLPTRKLFGSYRIATKEIKKDVVPRKDFASVQKLVKSYLNKKRNHVGNFFRGNNYEYTSNEPQKPNEIDQLVTANDIIMKNNIANPNNDFDIDPKFGYENFNTTKDVKEFEIADTNDNVDKKIMTLLDNLEKEVKHIELDRTDKEIFDSRIRKIYGTVVGKHDVAYKPTQLLNKKNKELNDNLINNEIAADSEFLNKGTYKNPAEDHKLYIYDDTRFIKRDQNSIRNRDNYKSIYKDYNNGGTDNNFHTKIDRNSNDQLSYDRRKYYQDKLDSLQRTLQGVRNNHHSSVNSPRHTVAVRPTKVGSNLQIRPSKSKPIDTFYIPDRARFIQGF